MRTRLIKGATGVALAVAALTGCTAAQAATTPTAVVTNEALRQTGLPACDEDAPDPLHTDTPCVWNDEDLYWVVAGGVEIDYHACPTEDSLNCVWDSGNDGPHRFYVNGPEER